MVRALNLLNTEVSSRLIPFRSCIHPHPVARNIRINYYDFMNRCTRKRVTAGLPERAGYIVTALRSSGSVSQVRWRLSVCLSVCQRLQTRIQANTSQGGAECDFHADVARISYCSRDGDPEKASQSAIGDRLLTKRGPLARVSSGECAGIVNPSCNKTDFPQR
jgi:hypothetical protein